MTLFIFLFSSYNTLEDIFCLLHLSIRWENWGKENPSTITRDQCYTVIKKETETEREREKDSSFITSTNKQPLKFPEHVLALSNQTL